MLCTQFLFSMKRLAIATKAKPSSSLLFLHFFLNLSKTSAAAAASSSSFSLSSSSFCCVSVYMFLQFLRFFLFASFKIPYLFRMKEIRHHINTELEGWQLDSIFLICHHKKNLRFSKGQKNHLQQVFLTKSQASKRSFFLVS